MRLIATNISNLTDARFFAAYQPEIMSMPALQLSEVLADRLEWLNQVRPWIEGPKWAMSYQVQPSVADVDALLGAKIETIIHACELMDFTATPGFSNLLILPSSQIHEVNPTRERIDALVIKDANSRDFEQVNNLQLKIPVFVEVYSVEHWLKIKDLVGKVSGIALKGGEEEKVGFKSYDHLSEICEALFS